MYRQEFPNPQFRRDRWENLNGTWEFEADRSVSGKERKLFEKEHLSQTIEVPFCPESKLSGVGDTDFYNCVWYRRDFVSHAKKSERVFLNFGAVDYDATIYVNGQVAFTHHGGYSSFRGDITDYLHSGVNSLCVCANDDDRSTLVGHGKQSQRYASYGCSYTRTTGIWQTVWVEYVPEIHLESFRIYPDVENKAAVIHYTVNGKTNVTVTASYKGKVMGEVVTKTHIGENTVTVPLEKVYLWTLGKGGLYDLTFTVGKDVVHSYFGMRTVELDGKKFKLNGKTVFQRTVLDQGFYPDGIYTASTKEALENDVILSMNAGFNGARLHQKAFEPLFLYYCDLHGYMVWGEYGSWGMDYTTLDCLPHFMEDWKQIVERDFNHPAIIGWCPYNETWSYQNRKQNDGNIASMYRLTKALDSTRPCIDTSGNCHVITDLFDLHDYTQDPKAFAEVYHCGDLDAIVKMFKSKGHTDSKLPFKYDGKQAFFLSEYGGIKWDVNSGNQRAWGYGNAPTTEKEFKERYKGLTNVLLDSPEIMGFCYTQLYDVEQETNGLYNYDRTLKFDNMDFFKEVNTRKAAIED